MKTSGNILLLLVVAAGLGSIPPGATAQTFSLLHTFTPAYGSNATNTDGANPSGALVFSGGLLYGTTVYGGVSGRGALFGLGINGAGFTNLHSFTGNSDGANPYAELTLSNNILFGTTSSAGIFGAGTVFTLNTDGTGFATLHNFTTPVNNTFGFYTNRDGAHSSAGLLLMGNTLYGTANDGGTSGRGTVFGINIDNSDFVTLHSFTSGSGGTYSSAGLLLLGNTLYGTDYRALGNGTVFAINTDGTEFTNHYAFESGSLNGNGVLTNNDGANPYAKLVLSAGILYGTTEHGGSSGNGTVFAITPDGTDFINLHNFSGGGYNTLGLFTNSDGANPSAGLTLSGTNLYGTANAGGFSGHGTVFTIHTDGTGFTTLYHFSATPRYPLAQTNSDGANPSGGLVLSGNTLYGATAYGGSDGNGTIFSLSFVPHLTILPLGTNVILTWPANFAGFDYTGFNLQSAPTLGDTFTNIPGATSPYVQPADGAQRLFRLSQ
jgi:uncharacterized repeat protein (TIGR03803 family)